ncbi:MAG: ActS/PrrB/RegB family redox-sensitive histidine kinase [Geminicoccaceae bacterium]|nr:ActS/PrrB/RegB family redox-sensitive histidine kinase [Geminicoccaceae bacterium]
MAHAIEPAGADRRGRGVRHALLWLAGALAGRGSGPPARESGHLRLHTVSLMRWVAVVGQLFTILVVHFSFGIRLPLAALLPAVGLSALLNVVLHRGQGGGQHGAARLGERHAVVIFGYDILQLTYLLALTGGVNNPFAFLVLLPVALSAMALGREATLGLAGLALGSILLQALVARPLPWFGGDLALPGLYTGATAIGLGLVVVLVAAYVSHMAKDARRQADALGATQLALARAQQLSALGGQAAAAAHLLGTPLGTINIIAKELVCGLPDDGPFAEDARDLLAQAKRCREILATLSGPGGDPSEHARFTAAPLAAHVEAIAGEHPRGGIDVRIERVVEAGDEEPVVALPPEIRHSLANLIDNAIEFARSSVLITLLVQDGAVTLTIQDDGPGFPPEVLDWLGEPFLSTRQEAGGLGLGIFIANTLLARTGAKLHFANNERGAWVRVCWPGGLRNP